MSLRNASPGFAHLPAAASGGAGTEQTLQRFSPCAKHSVPLWRNLTVAARSVTLLQPPARSKGVLVLRRRLEPADPSRSQLAVSHSLLWEEVEHQSSEAAGIQLSLLHHTDSSHCPLPGLALYQQRLCVSILNSEHGEDNAGGDVEAAKTGILFLTPQFSNCKTQLWCQLESVHPQDPPHHPWPQPFPSAPGPRSCKEAGGPARRALLVSSHQDDTACTIGLITPSSRLLRLSPRGQSFILFVFVSPGTCQRKSTAFAGC